MSMLLILLITLIYQGMFNLQIKLLRILVIRDDNNSKFFKKYTKTLNFPFELALTTGNDEFARETCITIELVYFIYLIIINHILLDVV